MKFGLYRYHEVLDDSDIAAIEAEYELPINVISVYRSWNNCNIQDDLAWLEGLKGSCRDFLLTWEPWSNHVGNGPPEKQPAFTLSRILSGRYDDYIRSFSQVLSEFPQTVYLRPMHEMNGNWYPWCGRVNDNEVELFVPAWHHIRKIVGEEVSSNIKFVWCPYATSYPTEPENAIERYFPGDEATDWVAIDGYNWGKALNHREWLSFEQIFGSAYKTITDISQHPVMIAEIACSESGGDKAEWIIETFRSLKRSFKRVELLIWFDINKECDWRMIPGIGLHLQNR